MTDKQHLLITAERALEILQTARSELDKARNWGIFDMLGGGLFSSLVKHDRLKEVESCLQDAQNNLNILHNELETTDLHIDLSVGLKFMDIWFDNIISDIMVQDKIKSTQEQVNQTIYQLQNIIARLKA